MTSFHPPNPDYETFVRGHFAAQGYLALLGAELVRIEPGAVEFRVPFRADLGQQDGVFHGGVIGGIAEAVMGSAAASLVPAGSNVVGAEYKINLLAPGAGEAIVAHGHVLKAGRRLIVCRADVSAVGANGRSRLCAIAQGAMAVVQPAAS